MLFVLFENPRAVFLNHLRYLDGYFRVKFIYCFVYNIWRPTIPDNAFVVRHYDKKIRNSTGYFFLFPYDFEQTISKNPKIQYKNWMVEGPHTIRCKDIFKMTVNSLCCDIFERLGIKINFYGQCCSLILLVFTAYVLRTRWNLCIMAIGCLLIVDQYKSFKWKFIIILLSNIVDSYQSRNLVLIPCQLPSLCGI